MSRLRCPATKHQEKRQAQVLHPLSEIASVSKDMNERALLLGLRSKAAAAENGGVSRELRGGADEMT